MDSQKIRENGIIGAGGAGFPSYVKASSKVETVIVNAAECEPLLRKDQIILNLYGEKVLDGLEKVMSLTGASAGIVAIKRKHSETVKRLKEICKKRKGLSVFELRDFYPAGDEFCTVYEVTGKVIPPGDIPLSVGCAVLNVETLYNIALNKPVTEKFITIAGGVKKPATYKVPVGITYAEAIELSGGVTVKNPVGIDGGPMMGKVVTDLDTIVSKTSSGIIILDASHPLIKRKTRTVNQVSSIGRSACDQCSFCTEFCPRYLLGHKIQPHRVMRTLMFSASASQPHSQYALLCCECSLCSLYSCPEGLSPKEACVMAKKTLAEKKINFKNSELSKNKEASAHPLRDFRKTPVKKLMKRLGLSEYDKEAPFSDLSYKPQKVRILLAQHIGNACTPCVKPGDIVKKGDIVADVKKENLGCPVHSSIDGKVVNVNAKFVEIESV